MIFCCVDTSAFYAYLVESDRFHEPVAAGMIEAVKNNRTLCSTSFVLCETLGLLQIRHGMAAAGLFMERLYPLVEWIWVDELMHQRMWELVRARKKRGFTIVDASVVACVEQRPGSVCIAVDKEMEKFGFEVLPVL
ncbi:MAG: PIN domain-containing protein [Pseudomonadota bacterium]